MPEIVAERAKANDLAPVLMLLIAWIGGDKDFAEATARPAILSASQYVEDTTSEIHDAEAVLETLVRCAGIDEPCEGQLMDVPQPLKGTRVDDAPLV